MKLIIAHVSRFLNRNGVVKEQDHIQIELDQVNKFLVNFDYKHNCFKTLDLLN